MARFQDVFAKLSLGNIGQSDFACSEHNGAATWAGNHTLDFSCPYGTLGALEFMGFPKLDSKLKTLQKNCKEAISEDQNFDVNATVEFMYPDCHINSGLLDKGRRDKFYEIYEKECLNNASCSINVNVFFGLGYDGMKESCRNEYKNRLAKSSFKYMDGTTTNNPDKDDSVPEPMVMARASCKSGMVKIPFTKREVSKDMLGSLVVLVDIVAVIIILLFIYILEMRQEEFIEAFKESTIQMDDYTLKVKNFPNDEEFLNEEYLLKAQIWDHMEKVLNDDELINKSLNRLD